MRQGFSTRADFELEVKGRFGILPNFFSSARAAPELIQELWGFAKAGYLDNPMPALFKERLFVWLSRYCPARYCIVRHVGFLLGHGRPAGDANAPTLSVAGVVAMLKRPTAWAQDMSSAFARLESLPGVSTWPQAETELEELVFACASLVFVEPARSERARQALLRALGPRHFEFLCGFLAFVRTAHYWTMLHPEIETEEDMRILMRDHAELCRLLLDDPEADRCEMSDRLFEELTALRELNQRQDLEKAKRALEDKDRQKDQFIAVLAHELRNPLAAIRAATDALGLMKLADPKMERFLARLDRQSASMARMLDDLLDASRIALGKVSVQIEEVDLGTLLDDIVGESAVRFRQAGLGLELDGPQTRCVVKGDRIRLRQVMDNLLSNAMKFTPSPGQVAIRVRSQAHTVDIEVSDTGIGFDESLAARLFEPFVQQEQTSAHSGGGLGLGLAISSKLAELQGGRLSASSPGANQGAVFTLTMPRVNPTVDLAVPAKRPPARKRWRVLLVEDNDDVADGLAELIELAGFDVKVAYDGSSALTVAVAERPDLIICDLGLPGEIDGYAVARGCRADSRLQGTRLIAASGYSGADVNTKAKAAGFDRLVSKPVSFQSLEALLHEMTPTS